MRSKLVLVTAFIVGLSQFSKADEGMWMLSLIGKNYKDMKKKGLKLKPKDIYNINKSSIKDAIVTLDHGSCTGEIISSQGLVLTNHHCGYGEIQMFSTPEHDYLTDGFWAMSKDKELYAPGKTMSIMVEMSDVTAQMLEGITDATSEMERLGMLQNNQKRIMENAKKNNESHFDFFVESFFDGNEFYMFKNITYKDIRLVGAPPSSVGKYGGDTDNWMWPRHTGDFCMFRIYTDANGKPADYSENNIPLVPKHHLPISMNGVDNGDFTMVFGYPGSTDRFLTSHGVKLAVEKDQPARVKIRRKKLDLMKAGMDQSDKIRIQYASKYAQVANYWKYFIGQSEQLTKNKVYDKKVAIENKFQKWADADPERKKKYGSVISDFATAYETKNKYWYASTYLNEAVFGPDLSGFIWRYINGYKRALESKDETKIAEAKEMLLNAAKSHFKDYNTTVDENIYGAMLQMYSDYVPNEIQPEMLLDLKKKYNNNFKKYAGEYFRNSPFTSLEKLEKSIDKLTVEQIETDKAVELLNSFIGAYRSKLAPLTQGAELSLEKAKRLFADGLRKMNSDRLYAPNANSTPRLTYGNVDRYKAKDGVIYDYYTTIDGLMAKEDPTNPEFVVPAKLKELYNKKDYGRYGSNGTLNVCFISGNDITGGNSGSPVINAKGELIGTAFDGNWEAMSGDIAFETQLQRTISVDIRYTLFIIDKYAGATNLINEMTLVEGKKKKNKKYTSTIVD